MKTEGILQKVQKMYRGKRFELDDEKENIIEYKWHRYKKSGIYFSDDDYIESEKEKIHFCTVEFARRLLRNQIIIQKPKRLGKQKTNLKIFGVLVTN